MDLTLTLVDAQAGESLDIVVTAEVTSTVADVEAALRSYVGLGSGFSQVRALPGVVLDSATDGLFVRGARLQPTARLSDGVLRPGDVVALGGARATLAADETVVGAVELRIVSGPAAGVVHRLGLGEFTVGSGQEADVRIEDPTVLSIAVYVCVGARGLQTRDLNGATSPWEPDQPLRLGDSAISAGPVLLPDAVLSPGPDGTLSYNRPPRLLPASSRKRIDLPAEPTAQQRRALPVVAMLAPLGLGVMIAAIAHNPQFLLFALMGPIMAGGSVLTERREGKKSNRTRRREYEAAKLASEAELADALSAEIRTRRSDTPDPALLLLTATGPRRRLWERRRDDDDSLLLRVGTGHQQADVELRTGLSDPEPKRPDLDDVPVTVSLRDAGVVGLAGPVAATRGLARAMLGQVAALHSPRDVSLVALTAARTEADWSWLRWLPHCAPPEGAEATAAIGNGVDSTPQRISELLAQVVARTRGAADARGRMQLARLPSIVVLLDGARDLRALPGMPQILQDGPAVGVFALCIDTDERRLPEECQAVVALDPAGTRATVRRSRGAEDIGVIPDLVSPSWAERVARAICPVRDVSADEGEATLPASLRLLDVLALDPPTADGVRARWLTGGRTTAALVGASAEGPFVLDLRRDGPHALVAGTTGAGKSEFLQTVIAALAVANRPDALTFVLVDYKGGSAFKDCSRLPHTVGMVTDLDGHLTERALTSLSAELKRRERVLGSADAKDIEDYWRAFDAGAAGPDALPLPRLVIVIDEFASMVEELPEFVRGLVGIAQRGRSLGVHLILATQRPSGVVSPEIRANTNLRVALRVTDAAESSDVIDAPDAARIARSTPGRGYARTGHASLTAFQAARVGGRRPGSAAAALEVVVVEVPWDRVGLPLPRPANQAAPDDDETDLHALVEAIGAANDVERIPGQRSPWLPALPDTVALADLPEPTGAAHELPPLPYGMEDLPAEQARRAAALDLEHGSHLIIAGAPRSGRSTALRTIAASLATTYSADDVHLYGIDCGNGALLAMTDLPHCGAVVTRHQLERGERLLARLVGEVTRRQELLALNGFADVAEQRAAAATEDRLPYLVVLLDRWEGYITSFDEIDAGRLTDDLMRLLREGVGAGVRFVIAGDRSALMGKVSNAVEDKLLLRLADRSDYSLAGLNPRTLPDQQVAGRAFRGESGLEVQLAMLGDGSGASQNDALRSIAGQCRPPTDRHRPFRVDVLPAVISYADAAKLDSPTAGLSRSPLRALVGVGGDELTAFATDLELSGPGFTIGGPPRSGRSTALLAMARGFLDARTPIVVFAPRQSPLRELAGLPGVVAVVTSSNPTELEVAELLNAAPSPLAVLIDDAELLHPSDAQPVLQYLVQSGRDETRCLVVAGTTEDLIGAFRGFTAEARKSRTGMLLSPESHQQGELLGIRLPRSSAFRGPAGRAILVAGGEARLVQVPLIDLAAFSG